ncbi:MAG TPA: hypothetical protein EYQ00_10920 [Dehalococcoidia bacterium]|nr:hypothetical protein [Dehalococcoidia bacterium]
MTNQQAIHTLFNSGIINYKTFIQLSKRVDKLNEKTANAVRQSEVNEVVETCLASLTPGKLFKHRSVWETVGRLDFERDEVLKSLRTAADNGLVKQVRTGANNFQIFWTTIEQSTELVKSDESDDKTEES